MKKLKTRRQNTNSLMVLRSLKTAILILLALVGFWSNGNAQCTPQPIAPNIALSNYSPCKGSTITVQVTSIYLPNPNWIASIIFPGGSQSISGNGNYNITANSSGNVFVYIQNNINNCPTTYTSNTLAITVLPNNKPTAQSDTIIRFCAGDNKLLFVTTPNGASTFQWKKNGVNIGTNNDTLLLNNMTAADTGIYKCFISSTTCPIDSSKSIRLNLGSIESQSTNANLCVGSNGILWVKAPSANTFVWKLNGTAIPNSNNDTLFINNYTTAQAGTYTCEASNNGSCLSTATFTITTNNVTYLFDFNGLYASYPMMSNANNAIANVNNGSVNSGCALTADRNGNANSAYNFDGTNNGTINMGDITAMNGASQLSISGWYKRSNVSRNDEFFSKVIDSAGVFSRTYNNQLYAYNTFGNNTSGYPVGSMGTNWFHYVLTFSSGTLTAYINGNPAGTVTNAAKPTIQSAAGSSFILGDIVGGGTALYPSLNFLGQMDEINIFNRVLTNTEMINLANAPQFLQHPQATTICAGNTLTLTAQAEFANATYQWRKNGVDISGATNATFTKTNAQSADAGNYTCLISLGCNRSISLAAAVTITPNNINITSQPQTLVKCLGQSASFSVTATGGTGYQWKKNGVTINGQVGSTLSIASVSLTDTGSYTCEIFGGSCGSTTSTVAALYINTPTVSITPSNPAICAGSSITLTANGSSAGTYNWSNSGGSNMTATYSPTTNTTYSVTLTDMIGCTATATKSVSVTNVQPFITFSSSPTICPNTAFTLTANGGTTYVWSNGGGSNASATFSPATTTTFTVTATTNGCTATATQQITVKPATTIITQPQTQSTCTGGTLSLSVTASGANLSYIWKKNGTVLATSGNLHIITNATAADAGTYTVDVIGDCGTVISSDAVVTVVGALQISQQPQNINLCNGVFTVLTVKANGANVNYTWKKNGTTIPNSNNDTLYFPNLSAADAGNYICEITSNCGNATSNTVIVTVNQPTSSTIAQSVCFGSSISFNGNTLTQSGIYKDTLANAAGCDSIITLNFTVRPQIVSNQSRAICNGSSFVFNGQTITVAGTYRDTLSSSNGCDSVIVLAVNVAQSSNRTISQSACGSYNFNGTILTQSGTYLDTITNVAGCDSFITLNLTIRQATASTLNDTICFGTTYAFGSQTLSTTGTYNRTIPNALGCDSVITLNLFVRPAINISITQSGFDLTATAGFTDYFWNLNGANITAPNLNTYTATINGAYAVQVVDANNCSALSNTINVVGVGIEAIENQIEISIYPNPVVDYIKVESESEIASISLYDTKGKLVKNYTEITTIKEIDVTSLSSATYILSVKATNGKSAVRSFIKE